MATARRVRWSGAHVQAAIVGVGAAAIVIWRVTSSSVFGSTDTWGYLALGRDFLGGHPLLYELTGAGKPLSTLLGALAAPLSTNHAFQIVIAVVLGAVVGVLYLTAYERAGPLAGAFAVAAFVATPGFRRAFFPGAIDTVTALLVAAAIASRGWLRVVWLVGAGLLRPEAWLVAGIVGGAHAGGTRARRVVVGAITAALAPALWIGFDTVFARGFRRSEPADRAETLASGAYEVAKSIGVEGGVVIATMGLLALGFRLARERRDWSETDLLIALMVTVWPATLAAMYATEVAVPSDRYVFPVVAVLALELGRVVGCAVMSTSDRHAKPAVIASIAWVALVVSTTSPLVGDRVVTRDYVRIARSVPALKQALSCGRLLVVGQERVGDPAAPRSLRGYVPQLAIATDEPLARFGLQRGAAHAAVLNVYYSASDVPREWPARRLPIGELRISPRCRS